MLSIAEMGLFLLVGAVVSLDVAGLTAVKSRTYTGSRHLVLGWAAQNAFWHAILLFVYGIVTVAAIDFVIPNVFGWLVKYLEQFKWVLLHDIAKEIENHILVALSTFTIIVVWRAYTTKIVENPFDVAKDDEGLQRRFVRRLLEMFGASAEFVGRHLQSMAVALDMLALAFLMRSLNFFGAPNHIDSYFRVASISALVFVSVFSVTVGTSIVFRRQFRGILAAAHADPEEAVSLVQILTILRIVEPLLIFYFLCEMMSFTVWRHLSSSSLLFIGAALLVIALVKQAGLENIRNTADAMVVALIRERPE